MCRPLEGKRIVITRAWEQSTGFAEKLADLGAQPVVFPTIQFVELSSDSLDDALQSLEGYDWLLFTSANAVRYFWKRLRSAEVAGALPRIAVVGSATAKAVAAESGLTPARMPRQFVAEQLADELGDLEGKRILLPRSRIGREDLVDALRIRGATVDDIAIYDTVAAEHTAESLAEIQETFDAITFASPSAVGNFLEILDSNEISRSVLNECVVACIGPTTAETARAEGLRVHVVPDEHTIGGLIDGLIVHFSHLNGSTAVPKSKAAYDQ